MRKNEFKKILTMSAGDYVSMVNKKLSDYTAEGFMICLQSSEDLERKISESMPKGTEAVVDYKITATPAANLIVNTENGNYYGNGTALIPK